MNIAQTAEFAVQQVFTVAGAEQATRDYNFSGAELLLVELAAANLQNNVGGGRSNRRGGSGGGDVMRWKREDRFVVGEGDGKGIDLGAGDVYFFRSAGLGIFDCFFSRFGGAGADGGFIPIIGNIGFGEIVLNVDLGRRVGVGTAVGFGVDQFERHFGHAGGLAVAGCRRWVRRAPRGCTGRGSG